jgi:hypothetical protein
MPFAAVVPQRCGFLLATYDTATERWVIAPGRYRFRIGASSRNLGSPADVSLAGARFSD